ncbi:MAG TPA: PQQ-binding-like beta-propeller repeat protein [Gemmataceae bacterium]|jgi:outer membrane protein assembly factor BamB|nr:PQQ-binding-like beta-propeller repeat protein [Gemmataceae bacterium]
MKSPWFLLVAAVALPAGGGGAYVALHPDCLRSANPAACKDGLCCEAPTRGQSLVAFAAAVDEGKPGKSDSPMFGGTPQRNMVNTIDKNVPIDFGIEEGKEKNVLWSALLGDKAYGGPVIANGRIYVGTNNINPRDPKDMSDGSVAVLMVFEEKTGKFLWQLKHPCPPNPIFGQARGEGLCSTPCVDAGLVYYTTPACVLVCADAKGNADGTGKIVWLYDMMKELNVEPFHLGNCSPLVAGDLVFVVTGNGRNDKTGKVTDPKAPSFAAFNKKTGKLAWKSDLPGGEIVEGQWSNPALGIVGGKPQVIFPGGDSVLYSFEPTTGKLLWKLDCQPEKAKNGGGAGIQNYFISTPVVVGDRLYVGLGVYPGGHPNPTKFSHVVCIDITKSGDVSPKNLDAKDPANKASALVWAYGGEVVPRPKKGRRVFFERTISTCAVSGGLVYIAEEQGYLHCLDAKTGEQLWDDDLKDAIWGSPYCVDGKVYISTESGTMNIYAAGPKKNVIASLELTPTIHSTPVVANGVLYVMTNAKLFAIVEKK